MLDKYYDNKFVFYAYYFVSKVVTCNLSLIVWKHIWKMFAILIKLKYVITVMQNIIIAKFIVNA